MDSNRGHIVIGRWRGYLDRRGRFCFWSLATFCWSFSGLSKSIAFLGRSQTSMGKFFKKFLCNLRKALWCHTLLNAYYTYILISSNLFTSKLEILIRISVLNSPKFCKSNSTFLMYSCLQHFIILHYCCYIPSSIILKGTRIYLLRIRILSLLWFVPRGSSSNRVNYVWAEGRIWWVENSKNKKSLCSLSYQISGPNNCVYVV